eukprot:2818520-Pleurochrysis_carterae.AAC.2
MIILLGMMGEIGAGAEMEGGGFGEDGSVASGWKRCERVEALRAGGSVWGKDGSGRGSLASDDRLSRLPTSADVLPQIPTSFVFSAPLGAVMPTSLVPPNSIPPSCLYPTRD